MSGLNLAAGGYAGGGAYAGAAGSMPTAANQPTGTTISRQAFGIRSGVESCGPRTAGLGSAAIGVASAAVLLWLWWTLPR
jgi:hypothetical protein